MSEKNGASRGSVPAAADSPGAAERAPDEPSAARPTSAAAVARKSTKKGIASATASSGAAADVGSGGSRLAVLKTYKLFVGGAFPRSESGRSYAVHAAKGGELIAYASQASRKDARDAVVAARAAFGGWSGATAYNRGQVLYRVAEMIEGRAEQFAVEVAAAEGVSAATARRVVGQVIDRWVWYAGWPDKVAQVAGGANPVAGPYFSFSVPEPTGVVAVLAPQESSLLGLVSMIAPVIATGTTAVVVASEQRPLPAITLTEALATSDVPGGVVNILTGRTAELAPVLAGHFDVNAIDLTGAAARARADLERLAAANVKRVFCAEEDWTAAPAPRRLLAFVETKTVWHPVGI
jgi:acyl-CoA reductase-like NAD-dependent aldehyde dehydrogenase